MVFMLFTKLFLPRYANLFAKWTNEYLVDAAVIFSVKHPHLVWWGQRGVGKVADLSTLQSHGLS